jgi:tRNA(Arg) A34 adenosine deaminase TadA
LRAVELSKSARANGNAPFGSLLVDVGGEIVLEQENIEITERDCTGHAETALMRNASKRFDRDYRATCTLYTSCEPCAMCAVAVYWGNVRRLVYGMAAAEPIEVIGPVEAVRHAAAEAHAGFWGA